jgi:hypothetical protein
MAAALTLTTALAACASPAPRATGAVMVAAPLRVTDNGLPFAMDEGARAKRVAMDTCAATGRVLRPSIYDRFDKGAWIFVEGCA